MLRTTGSVSFTSSGVGSAPGMASYRYVLADMEKNHEAYIKDGRIAMSSEARSLIRSVTETGNGPLKRLGLG